MSAIRRNGVLVMKDLKCVMFDCMETLIDMTELPDEKDYALWAFRGSGCEKYFKDFSEFYECYKKAGRDISSGIPENREYSFKDQYKYIVEEKGIDTTTQQKIVQLLLKNFCRNYRKRCYVDKMIKDTLEYLNGRYKLGVVSNFKVTGGIENLLEYTGIRSYFEFVINSAEEGWRKPHPKIYMNAAGASGLPFDKIVFVGDNFINDYLGPKKVGMDSIFFDKKGCAHEDCRKINEFMELKKIL